MKTGSAPARRLRAKLLLGAFPAFVKSNRAATNFSCVSQCHRPRRRTIQYSRGVNNRAEKPRSTGYPACAGYDGTAWSCTVASLRLLGQIRMRAAEIGGGGILADLDDAAADGAGAGKMLEQRIAVAPADRAGE